MSEIVQSNNRIIKIILSIKNNSINDGKIQRK